MRKKSSITILFLILSFNSLASENVIVEPYQEKLDIKEEKIVSVNTTQFMKNDPVNNSFIKYKISKDKDGYLILTDGLYENSTGSLNFDIKISESSIGEAKDYLDIFMNAEKFNIKSNSFSTNSFFNFLDDQSTFNESYHIIKDDNSYFVKSLKFETLDYSFEFEGQLTALYNSILIDKGVYRINDEENYIEGYVLNDFINKVLKDFMQRSRK